MQCLSIPLEDCVFLFDIYGNYSSYKRWILWTCAVVAWFDSGWLCGVRIAGNALQKISH